MAKNYPEIDTISNKLTQIKSSGYEIMGYFILPKRDWIENYYNLLENNLKEMEIKYTNINALEIIKIKRSEKKLFDECSNDYSYVFYAMKKL